MRKLEKLDQNAIPSFETFLRYLGNRKYKKDFHWEKYYETCSPCSVPYEIIGHLETSSQDTKMILDKSNLHKYADEVEYLHLAKNGSSFDRRKHYFSKVPCSILRKVYDEYKIDFEFFGYDPNEHFKLCKNE